MPQDILIPAPEGSKYLSEIFNIHTSYGPTLPKNCLFDKVTTGCGGSTTSILHRPALQNLLTSHQLLLQNS